ncbi:rod shape-determining protein RodA [Halochromatium glycolicum]|uniref:Peptidoglycan glycosyltransferase MrdB n=1 Tax=Halochromatium glycolicum TaxID=85075 RepID=A0AAJ0XBA3_9GAMM|nr:rod shape-determining protein RodA [Halochromatium glycolicum]MBK1705965.1 rod shape-determining protein RodA [Halochromatium glycolicum]
MLNPERLRVDAGADRRESLLATRLHIDLPLLLLLALICGFGLIVLYSATGESVAQVQRQGLRLAVAAVLMLAIAQLPPAALRQWSVPLFLLGLGLLVMVLTIGEQSKGAQRWLDLGFVRFQPSEILKLALPMMLAWYLSLRALPPRLLDVLIASLLIALPVLLIAKQPDLGTALLVGSAGVATLFLAGLRWRLIIGLVVLGASLAPLLWSLMRDYQRQRVLTFLDPSSDPLGAGYHIIQSQIAIGSGGLYGKGWLAGTQSHLEFLPERSTDFIFAVLGEELGLSGVAVLMLLYLAVILRGLAIAAGASDTYSRLLAGSVTAVFFVYLFVNMGMVTGLLPVVGVPLPLISYGGTSLVTLMMGFGILMSVQTHRKTLQRE